jgi:UDP-N-acetyl-2-amino-2-deoxyglucuronate dehydrogenase
VNQTSAESAKGDFGFEQAATFTNHKVMLDAVKPEMVITSLWTALHLPIFRDCVDAGVKCVHSEKPMAQTWGECREMADLAKSSGVVLTFSHQRRFAEGSLLARKWMQEGVFGAPLRLEMFSPPHFLDCGTHTFDQAMSMMNESPGRWIMAAADTSTRVNYFDVPAEGICTANLVFENGVRGTIQCGGPDMEIWGGLRLTGEKGFFEISWDGEFRNVRVYDDPAFVVPTIQPDGEGQMRAMMSHILDCYESGIESEVSLQKAMRAAEIIFTGYESIRRRERLEIPCLDFDDNPIHDILNQS